MIVVPLTVPVTTTAPAGGVTDAEELKDPGEPPPGIEGAAVGQLLAEGCRVYDAHPRVVVPDDSSGRSGTFVPSQSAFNGQIGVASRDIGNILQ